MGGPAHHVGLLGSMLDPDRYETLLLHGEVGAGEDSLEPTWQSAREPDEGTVPGLRPEISPHDDARALRAGAGDPRAPPRHRPHPHRQGRDARAARGGRGPAAAAGRWCTPITATCSRATSAGSSQPTGESSSARRRQRPADRRQPGHGGRPRPARRGPALQVPVVPVGLDLAPFFRLDGRGRRGLPHEVGVQDGEVLLTFVGRLVPIKRVDVLLHAVSRARSSALRCASRSSATGAAHPPRAPRRGPRDRRHVPSRATGLTWRRWPRRLTSRYSARTTRARPSR